MDRISSLPNEIISHIVSFLSAKEAAFATVLSKRWQYLYTIIQNLEFDDKVENQGSLIGFLDEVLALPLSSRVRTLSLKCFNSVNPTNYAQVNRCLCDVLKRGVVDLKLDLWVQEGYSLPFEVFTCKTLVELKLGTLLKIDNLPENALLPALKTLIIETVRFTDLHGCAFQKLLSACPVLVELVMRNVEWEFWEWSRTVSSPTLERLTINHKYCFGVVNYDIETITFDTPSLTYFKYFDFAPRSYPIVNLGSLAEATVGLTLPYGHAWTGQYRGDNDTITSDLTNLINGLRNVEILDLYAVMTMEAIYFSREAIPVFERLHHLSVTTEQQSCWRTLPYLLKKSPSLKTLVIVGPLHYDLHLFNEYGELGYVDGYDDVDDDDDDDESDDDEGEPICECLSEYSFLLLCPVKVLEITEYSGSRRELEHMQHFLEKLSSLELVKVCVSGIHGEEQSQVKSKLLNLPRSPKCKIEFEFIPPRFASSV